jgi:hypothetical protein
MPDDLSATQGNMLPEAVRRQAERADALLRQIGAAGAPPEDQNKSGTEFTTAVNEGEQQGQPAPDRGQPSPEEGQQGELPLEGGEYRGEPPTPAEQPREQDAGYWKQRHDTVQGKYNAETAELRGRVRALEGHIASLQELLAKMNTMPAQQQPPAQVAFQQPPPQSTEITDEDRESYGDELIHNVGRWSRAQLNPEIENLKRQLEELRGQASTANATLRQNHVHAMLDAQVPDWQQIDHDSRFIAWLDQVDPFTGYKRQQLLNDAYQRGDAPRTTAFFQAFLREHTAQNQPPRSPPAHTRAQPGGAGSVPLAELAAPGRGRPASPGAPPEKRLWSQQDIAAFYSDVNRGRFRGRESEKVRLEKDVFAAISEGRIRN